MSNTYTCDSCGGVFNKGWSDKDALAERLANGWEDTDCGLVCDDCYQKMIAAGMPVAEPRMDNRRLDTGQALAGGILGITPPVSRCPKGIFLTHVNEEDCSRETMRAGLQACGLEATMYYGLWRIWRKGDRFDGELMQYRNVTDQFSQLSLDDAIDKAEEWVAGCYG